MIVDDRITAYLNTLEDDLPEYLLQIEKEAREHHVPIIRKETQGFLKFLLDVHQPVRILEVGTAVAFSALLMSEITKPETTITTIEKVPMRIIDAKKNLEASQGHQAKKITLLEGDAIDVLSDLCNQKQNYDFIFMDAAKAQYMSFFPYIMQLLKEKGVLVTDNVLQDGTVTHSRYGITRRDRTIHSRMREYLYELKHNDSLNTTILPIGDGVAYSIKNQ